MNDKTTHQDWHPQDSPEYLTAAIDRVREDYMMQDERPPIPGLTKVNTGVIHDVYRGWFISERGMIGIERRMRRRSIDAALAAYDAEPALPERTAPRRELEPRKCANPACGITFFPSVARQVYHDQACGKRAARKRYTQRKGAA